MITMLLNAEEALIRDEDDIIPENSSSKTMLLFINYNIISKRYFTE